MSISTGPLELDAGGSVCQGFRRKEVMALDLIALRGSQKRHADQIGKLEDNVKTFSYRPNGKWGK